MHFSFKAVTAVVCLSLLFAQSCKTNKNSSKAQDERTELVDAQSSPGWTDIFDGKTFDGWHGYNKDAVGEAWQIDANGAMYLDKSKGEGGDIITDGVYENFEMALDWKIADCGNSGIFWNIVESKEYGAPYLTAPEMQVLDNKCHPDAKIDTHRAGDLYDMIETSVVNVKPAGQWNSIKIRSNRGEVTFWQNGVEVVKFTMHDEAWAAMVAKSKFKNWESFGKSRSGRLGLQDHGDMVWYKNIRIRTL